MGEGIYYPPVMEAMIAFLAVSLIVLIVGALLRRQGRLRTRGAGLIWACLVVTPAVIGIAIYWAGIGTEATRDGAIRN